MRPNIKVENVRLSGLGSLAEYLRAVRGRRLGAHRPTLPGSSDEGAYVELETGNQEFERRSVETGLSDGITIGQGDNAVGLPDLIAQLHAAEQELPVSIEVV